MGVRRAPVSGPARRELLRAGRRAEIVRAPAAAGVPRDPLSGPADRPGVALLEHLRADALFLMLGLLQLMAKHLGELASSMRCLHPP